MWTQMQECLAFNPDTGSLQFVNRGYSPTGILYTHQTDYAFTFWAEDFVYNESFGKATYPTSIASYNGPGTGSHICMPTLGSLMQWGYMVAQYNSGGWFSSVWDTAVDLGPGDVDVHKVIGKQLPSGNMLFIGVTETDQIIWKTWDYALTGEIASGAWSGRYVGFDINGGVAYVFYENGANPPTVYYRSTTDGITWSPESTWAIPWPDPYSGENNYMFWTQAAVTDTGTPVLVFDILWDLDPQFPLSSKVYVSTAPGTILQVSDDAYPHCGYPTIATGGGVIAVLYQCVTDSTPDSLTRRDGFVTMSSDGGMTWSVPYNFTADVPNRPGLFQLAKRPDPLHNRMFYVFDIDILIDHDPYWNYWQDPDGMDAMGHYVGWYDYDVGVTEYSDNTVQYKEPIHVYPNPATHTLYVDLLSDRSTLISVYDCCGQTVYTTTLTEKGSIDISSFSRGVYFVVVGDATQKLIKIE
jgi:hypothetical protein